MSAETVARALEAALDYASRDIPLFPASQRKQPLVNGGFHAATTAPDQIRRWWAMWPYALIGMPTGERTGIAALDIDVKNGVNGFRTLAGLGYPDMPRTPAVLTQSGGMHLHFKRPDGGFRCTAGSVGRGIGEGLDWRCDGGYVILPSPGSGYRWGDWHGGNCLRLPVPDDLLPRPETARPPSSTTSNRLAWVIAVNSLDGVLRRLHRASRGERNCILFWAAKRFAEAVEAGFLSEDGARDLLSQAAKAIGLSDRETVATLNSAF